MKDNHSCRSMPAQLAVAGCLAGLLAVASGCRSEVRQRDAQDVSLETLLARLTNVAAIAEQPLGRSYLVSTYDRSGGNADRAIWTSTGPDGRITLLDVEGPGYVSRIWCTHLKISEWGFFFDGESEPRLGPSTDELFNDQQFPFVEPLSGESGGGRYCLMPIPFEKRLRIAVKPTDIGPDKWQYYHINYTLLDDRHELAESWPAQLTAAQSNAIERTRSVWAEDRAQLGRIGSECLERADEQTLRPGESTTFVKTRGAGCVDAFAVEIVAPDGGELLSRELLRRLRLKMWWDGSRTPSVDVPLGDFFCNAFYTREYASYVLGRIDGVFVSRLPMPFRRKVRCVIENNSEVDVALRVGARLSDDPGFGRLFHANWAASTQSGRRFNMLRVTGSGHYIGSFLSAIGQDGSWTILEGDETVWPDRGSQPAQYGTGLEDYFNGAYYYTSLFDLPQHGLIEKGAMRTDQYRFHGLEAVEFEDSMEVTIEFGHANRAQGYMSNVAYWYADRPHDCTLLPAQEPLLDRPADRFELAGFMAQLFTLERGHLWEDAAARCDFMAARYAREAWSDIFRLRAAAYRERVLGFEAVKPEYERIAAGSPMPAIARQAQDLLWLHEGENHALLGMHMRGQFKLWLDEKEMGAGTSHAVLQVRRLIVAPGRHTWKVDFTPTMQGSFVSLCLRTRWGDITSAGDWGILEVDPLPDKPPPEEIRANRVLPNMTVWQFQPNAYVGMQSAKQCVELWPFYAAQPRVKRVILQQDLQTGPTLLPDQDTPPQPIERTEQEERAHAIE